MVNEEHKREVAIACQGGGSHTAFTAGALQRILEEKDKKFEITALSGTSGGAVCALLTWYGLINSKIENGDNDKDKGKKEAIRLLNGFWDEISADTPWRAYMNAYMVEAYRGHFFPFSPPISPYECSDLFYGYDFPQLVQDNFRGNLKKYVDFAKINKYFNDGSLESDSIPELIIGATDVCSGDFKVFRSTENVITVDMILASAAEPNFFKAVDIDEYLFSWDDIPGNDNGRLVDFLIKNYENNDWVKTAKIEKIDNGRTIKVSTGKNSLLLSLNNEKTRVNLKIDNDKTGEFNAKTEHGKLKIHNIPTYWDGLFSRNPPISAILEGKEAREKPDEIWVIQIDPKKRKSNPTSFNAIEDRRNELSGNLSLEYELHFMDVLNKLIEKHFPSGYVDSYKHIDIKQIEINANRKGLDYASKWRLDPKFIREMMDYGREEAKKLLA